MAKNELTGMRLTCKKAVASTHPHTIQMCTPRRAPRQPSGPGVEPAERRHLVHGSVVHVAGACM